MAKPRWSIKKVDELKQRLLWSSSERVMAFFEETGLESLPARIDGKGSKYATYQGKFSYEWLWGTLAFRHDIELYDFFRSMGMPLINEIELAEEDEVSGRDKTFYALTDRNRYGLSERCGGGGSYKLEREAAEISEYLEHVLDDGWKPCGEETSLPSMWESLLVYMPTNPGLLKRFENAGFDVIPEPVPASFWCRALARDKPESILYVVEHGHVTDLPILVGKFTCIGALNAAIDAGLNIAYVVSNCSREVLVRCAEVGAKPVSKTSRARGPEYPYIERISDFSEVLEEKREAELRPGDFEICKSLDYEVIESFVSRGLLTFPDSWPAREAGREDIVALLDSYKCGEVARKVEKSINYGPLYSHDGIIEVPEGVECIEDMAFEGVSATEIRLPNSLKTIKYRAFGGPVMPEVVTIPKSVICIDRSAFQGTSRFVIYDTITPQDKPSYIARIGAPAGALYGLVGDFYEGLEITVKSAEDDSIKYRVWLPCFKLIGLENFDALMSSWGPHADFNFTKLDRIFGILPNEEAKCRTAINRLLWPVGLVAKNRRAYEKFLSGNGELASKMLIDDDDPDSMKKLEALNIVTKDNVGDLLLYAKAGNYAPKATEYLEERLDALGARSKKMAKNLRGFVSSCGWGVTSPPCPAGRA